MFQQITGINTVIYHAPMIFGFAGFHPASVSILVTAGVGAINLLLTMVAVLLLDRAGRRPLLLWGWRGLSWVSPRWRRRSTCRNSLAPWAGSPWAA